MSALVSETGRSRMCRKYYLYEEKGNILAVMISFKDQEGAHNFERSFLCNFEGRYPHLGKVVRRKKKGRVRV